METSRAHAVLLSSPGMGHLIPILELGNRLSLHHNFSVTIFNITKSGQKSPTLDSAHCHIIDLPPMNISHVVPPDATMVTACAVTTREAKPVVRSAISDMEVKPSLLIVDLFGTDCLCIADELGIPDKYVYIATNAWFVSLILYLPTLDKLVKGEYIEQTKDFEIPGCRPVRPDEVIDPMRDRSNQQYEEMRRIGLQMPEADGILINIWEDLEPSRLKSLRDENLMGSFAKKPIYTVGPLTWSPTGSASGPIFEWLDKQPAESVMFLSFGSGGMLSHEQTTEVAWGLELSQQRFIWVVRAPTVGSADAAYFSIGKTDGEGKNDKPFYYLPEGFLTRTRDRGMVVPGWAPQVDILKHPSVGGFLSHCGWNSALESVTNGVPMIAWPLYAEQTMNSTILTEELGVAVRPRELPAKGVVRREEIEKLVWKMLVDKEGLAIRDKVKKLKESGERALSFGGTSHGALSQVAKKAVLRVQESG